MSRRWFGIVAGAIVGGFVLGGALLFFNDSFSASSVPGEERSVAPKDGAGALRSRETWEVVAPTEAGFDAVALEQIAARAEAAGSNCLVIVRDGRLAGEWYFNGADETTAQNIYSVSKSIASTLIGIAQDDGDLAIGDRASTWIPAWQGTPSEMVTVRNLLSNNSGREWSAAIDYIQLLRAPDRTAFAIGLTQSEPPGTVWAYNNSAIQTLQPILQRATRQDVVTFAKERLFEPLGMNHTTMATDPAGNAQMFQGVRSTCRDLARFGQLMLNQGRWGEAQIVSSEWVEAATGRPSTDLVANYGHLWWLNREGILASPAAATSLQDAESGARSGRIVLTSPDSMYWALGFGNQIVQIDPNSNTVVIRLGTAGQSQGLTFGAADAARVVTEAVIDD
jgi:CubicO group peptidase (beta-lactamase class C family)